MDFLHGVPHWQKSVRLKDTCGCRLSASISGICQAQLVKGFSRRPTTRETMHARMSLAHHLHHMLPIRTLMTSEGRRSSKPATCALSRNGGGPPGMLRAFEKDEQMKPAKTMTTHLA